MSKDQDRKFFDGLPCCDDVVLDPPQGQEDCLDVWEKRLEQAENDLERANAKFSKFNGIYNEAVAWEKKLEGWYEDLCDAYEKTDEISSLLKTLIRKVGVTIQNGHATRKSVEAVLCLVKDIFECIVELIKVCPPEETEGLLQKLKDAINCDPNLDDAKKYEILECIKLFEDKIMVAYALQKTILEQLLEILNCANLLVGYLQKRGGLKWQLKDLQRRIMGAVRRNNRVRHLCYERDMHVKMDEEDDDVDDPIEHGDPDEPCNVYDPPCGKSVFRPDQILFPIRDSQYYKKVKDLHKEAVHNAECLKGKKEDAAEYRDYMLDRKTQYQNAVNASTTAEEAGS